MILMISSQVQMNAQKKGGPDYKRPGSAVIVNHKPGRPIGKAISQGDIERLRDFYWRKYRVRLSRKEAERILIEDMRDKRPQRPPRK